MTTPFHLGVDLAGIYDAESHLTFAISGTVTTADVGKPASLDTTANSTVKIAAAGDEIIGVIRAIEVRSQEGTQLATVCTKYSANYTLKSGDAAAVGDTVVGAGGGEVKKAAANNSALNIIVAKTGSTVTVLQR